MTNPVTSAAKGRYIRRSAPTSLTIGTKLEVGSSTSNANAPTNPGGEGSSPVDPVKIETAEVSTPEASTPEA